MILVYAGHFKLIHMGQYILSASVLYFKEFEASSMKLKS